MRADKMLYAAKQGGRNAVRVAEPSQHAEGA
jgi:PleD family two-component response regulator